MSIGVRSLNEEKLHPTIREFKQFVNQHPKLLREIRKNGRSWQEYYEKWVLLGEEDPFWTSFQGDADPKKDNTGGKHNDKDKKTEIFSKMWEMTENLDMDKVQKQVHQLNGAISSLQDLLGQFQTKGNKPSSGQQFGTFKD
ncbi:spore coat protein YlbD [Virgibacillus halophilus]|uniref:Spore coat protein YlbD n=1 Tax=Tigheibacillus halophilus TaxID=361280 RepID=A0ABU5CAC5_9BACI|nr:spore coat protein YlbD [Virgibacillus halophilus]